MHTMICRKHRGIGAAAFVISLLMLLLLGLESPALANGPIYKFVGKGAFGSANWSWSDPNVNGWVSVTRGGTAKEPTTWLQYRISLADDPWTDLESGTGLIPNGDLSGNGVTALSLNTDTTAGANPDFYRYAGNGGVIAIDWNGTSLWWTRYTGTQQTHIAEPYYYSGGNVIRYKGTSECSSASFQGNIFGTPIEGTSPNYAFCFFGTTSMGTNHQTSIEIQQGP